MKKARLDASHCLLLCMGEKCRKKNRKLKQELADALAREGLGDHVALHETACMHRCDNKANIALYPPGTVYGKAGKKSLEKILRDVTARAAE